MPGTRYVPRNGELLLLANRCLLRLLSWPLSGLLTPIWLLLLIGYPSLNELSQLIPNYHNNDDVRAVIVERTLPLGNVDVTLRSFDLPFNTQTPISSLNNLYAIESEISKGLDSSVQLYSILDYWNMNKTSWENDDSIFNTIQLNNWKVKGNQRLSDITLFSGTTLLNGVIVGISSANIIVMYPSNKTIDNIITRNMKNLSIVSNIKSSTIGNIGVDYNLKLTRNSNLESFLMSLLPCIIILMVILTTTNVQSLSSKYGVLFAFICQFILSIMASVSLTKVLIIEEFVLFHQLPIIQLLWLPFLITWESCGNIITNYTKFNDTESFSLRLRMSILNSFSNAVDIFISTELILYFIYFFSKSRLTNQYCIFTIICILINFIMIFTFFTMVLALDYKRSHSDDAINSSLNRRLSITENSFLQNLFKKVSKVKFPLFKSFLQQLLIILLFLFIFIRWTAGDYLFEYNHLDIFLNKRGFVLDIEKILNIDKMYHIKIRAFKPIEVGDKLVYKRINSNWNFIYIFEILSISLFLICSSISLIKYLFHRELKLTNGKFEDGFIIPKTNSDRIILGDDNELTILKSAFKFKELVKGHTLDVVKIYTSTCPFIVSVGLDNKILVWSPMNSPIPLPVQLPIPAQFLPINCVSMSDSGSLIAIFLKSGKVKCWSRLSMSWVWDIDVNKSALPLESFFRKKKSTAKGSRRTLVSRASKAKAKAIKKVSPTPVVSSKSTFNSKTSILSPSPLLSPSPSPITPKKVKRFTQVNNISKSLSIDSDFDKSSDLKKLDMNTRMEFVIVLKDGSVISVDCQDGEIENFKLSDSSILVAKKLSSPRVNDRIVAIKEDGAMVVSTAVNNKWIPRLVKIDNSSYNMGKSLVTPAVLLKEFEHPVDEFDNLKKDDHLKEIVMETVPFVGMIVRAFSMKAELLDVQTGIILKEWSIAEFIPNSFKVFHPEPSHCSFCGCASVATFSIGYTELETNTLMVHTFSIENRAKNSICLRVERDSRETRCLGFASVTEHIHWLSNVEGWCASDFNMLMGVRKKEQQINIKADIGKDTILKNRKKKVIKPVKEDSKINDIWEGWTMSSDGQVKIYELPDASDSGLSVKKIGPIQKFGHKSIIVPFGNVMKIFYLGNDNLIEDGASDNESSSSMSKTSNSLSFNNRKEKMRLKKYDLTHSTKFDEGVETIDITE